MLLKANNDLVRRQNRALVLDSLRQHGPMARIHLGQRTGLSPASITSITADMLQEGLLRIDDEDQPAVRGQRGRPQTKISLNPDAAQVMAITVSAKAVQLVISDFLGGIVSSGTLDIDTFKLKAEEFAPLVAQHVRAHAKQHRISLKRVVRISVAVQGVADTVVGSIAWSPAFRASNIPVTEPLSRIFRVPCAIANDANRIADGLLAEDRARFGGITAVVFMGHGVGLGLILDGKVYEGANGRASEFGHVNHDPLGPDCRCGRRGCLEAYCADYGILRMGRGTQGDLRKPVSSAMMNALQLDAEAGELRAAAAYEKAGEVLGFSLARMIALVNPQLVVFTGPGTSGFPLMKPSLEKALQKALVRDLYENVQFDLIGGDRDLIISGTLTEALRHLDREVFSSAGNAASLAAE